MAINGGTISFSLPVNSTNPNDYSNALGGVVNEAKPLTSEGGVPGLGGLPDYSALLNQANIYANMNIQDPDFSQLDNDTASLNQVAATMAAAEATGGPQTLAAEQQVGDQLANYRQGLTAQRQADTQGLQSVENTANQASAQAGQMVLSARAQAAINNIQKQALIFQIQHANAQFRNQGNALAESITNANNAGLAAVQNASQTANNQQQNIRLTQGQQEFQNDVNTYKTYSGLLSGALSTGLQAFGTPSASPAGGASGNAVTSNPNLNGYDVPSATMSSPLSNNASASAGYDMSGLGTALSQPLPPVLP